MTQSDMQEMDVDSDDCGLEPKTLTMLIQQYKDMDLNADINDNFWESEYNPEAKQFLSKEMFNLKDTKPFIQLYEKVQEFDEICANIDLVLMIALLHSGSKQYLKMEEIYKGIILYGNQKLDQKSYIRISMFFKIITMISTVVNIKNNDFWDEYISVVESDLINALKVWNYLLVDAEIINNDNDLIFAMHELVSCALTNTRLKSSEIFSIWEEFFINLSWNPSKWFEDISFSLAVVLFKVTDCLYHKDIVNYFMQMLMSFLLSKENPSEDTQKLKKIIPTKIGAIISIFLWSSDSKTLAPGLELVISSILGAKENNMKIWNLFSVVSRIWIIKVNDPQKELMMNVYECLNLWISMYDKNWK